MILLGAAPAVPPFAWVRTRPEDSSWGLGKGDITTQVHTGTMGPLGLEV